MFSIYLPIPHAFNCTFQKHPNSEVQKLRSQLCFSLPSIIIRITSNKRYNTETHKTDRNPPITNHKPWPFELIEVNFCFPRGPPRWYNGSKECKSELAFELQNSRVFEKHSNSWIREHSKNKCILKIVCYILRSLYDMD